MMKPVTDSRKVFLACFTLTEFFYKFKEEIVNVYVKNDWNNNE